MPALTAIGVVLIGGWYMLTTAPGHIPDVWSHIYRMAGILNGDVMARPVDSVSYLHGGTGNVGGHVDWEWIEYSQQHYDGYDPTVVRPTPSKYPTNRGRTYRITTPPPIVLSRTCLNW